MAMELVHSIPVSSLIAILKRAESVPPDFVGKMQEVIVFDGEVLDVFLASPCKSAGSIWLIVKKIQSELVWCLDGY